ncbi:MAG: hypothetical protein EU549_02430 [Promethearchaeota archaeon]|nr:MAG: hypothetical protein EU549_02430 [Candidatus Lokiarchaeota archaeon]
MTEIPNYSQKFDIITISRDFSMLGLIIASLFFMKEKQPLIASYATMGILLMLVIHPILRDLITSYSASEYMLYRTLTILIIGELLISSYAIKRSQVIIYTLISLIILTIHFFILLSLFYRASTVFNSIVMFFECIFFLIASGWTSTFLFGLTFRSRVKIIDNIVFFKMTEKGPEPLFFEHSIDYNLLLESGIYFYTAIGQGIRYRTGLFGPLPIGGDTGDVTLIYSAIVNDSDFKGSRLKGKNYIMIAFLGDENDLELIERTKLMEILEKEISKIPDLAHFGEHDFERFINSIRNR